MNEPNIKEEYLESDIKVDAYLYWRRNKKEKKEERENSDPNSKSFSVKFESQEQKKWQALLNI